MIVIMSKNIIIIQLPKLMIISAIGQFFSPVNDLLLLYATKWK